VSDRDKLSLFELAQQFLGTLITNTQISRWGTKWGVSEVNNNEHQEAESPRKGNVVRVERIVWIIKKVSGTWTAISGLKAELREYKMEEWRALTPKSKEKVRELRKARDKAKRAERRASRVETAKEDT
jgi:hypothetical protein